VKYDRQEHHRRSIRLKGYDYSQAGAYFVTVCTQGRACLFGQIVNGRMWMNNAGKIVRDEWLRTAAIRPNVELHAFVVMPNHFHGIIVLHPDGRGTLQRAPTLEQFGKPTSNTIPTIVRLFKSASTRRINEMRNTPGTPVWQRNYYEHVIRNDVACFQAVRAALVKRQPSTGWHEEELGLAIRQIISRAIAPEGVLDLFAAAGIKKPDISVLSDEFLREVEGITHKNLAVEVLRRLLDGEIKVRKRKNVVLGRSFAELLERAIRNYQNRTIDAAQVIAELIALAKQIREADRRGERLGLSEEELAFYDALETNDSAVKVLGESTLKRIALDLVQTVRSNVSIDWDKRENARANLRRLVKRILRKYGYPPDKQGQATQTVIEQAEVLFEGWTWGAAERQSRS
jgi:REP element-mobilizing transposase RayT